MSNVVYINGIPYQKAEEGEVPYNKAVAPNANNPAYNTSGTHVTGADPYSTGVNYGSDTLVQKLADQVIPLIRQQSYCRQFFRVMDMPVQQIRIPKIATGAEVFYIGEANPSPFTAVGTTSAILNAKKLMTMLTLSSELTEDNIVPILPHIKRDVAKAFALAEEEVFLYGNEDPTTAVTGSTYWGNVRDTDGNSTADAARTNDKTTTAAANDGGWFVSDKRMAFDGVSLLSEPGKTSTTSSGTPPAMVDVATRPISIDDINDGIERLDVFGRDKSQLLLVVSLREEKNLRADPTILTTLERFGPSAPFLTGEIGKVFGVSVVATNLIPKTMGTIWDDSPATNATTAMAVDTAGTLSEAFLINRNALVIGDRRFFTMKASDIPLMFNDQLLITATERIGLVSPYRNAMVKLENIGS